MWALGSFAKSIRLVMMAECFVTRRSSRNDGCGVTLEDITAALEPTEDLRMHRKYRFEASGAARTTSVAIQNSMRGRRPSADSGEGNGILGQKQPQ